MTPFGAKMRSMRAERGLDLKTMAHSLGVSSAYLSALEHGKRGRPGWALLQAVITYFNVIWDEADELARLADISHPRVVIDTSGLDPQATILANRLARDISDLGADDLAAMIAVLDSIRTKPASEI